MSTNKQQLQLNNTDLQSILSAVLGLPTQESVKHGVYAWKRYDIGTVENPIIHISGSASSATVTCDSVDLTKVDELFFDGFVVSTNYYFFVTDGQLYYHRGSNGNFVCTYDPTTQTLSNSSGATHNSSDDVTYTGTKTYKITDSITIAVADSESAYPDGGTQGSYYYEKMSEKALDESIIEFFEDLGYSKVTVDTLTLTSNLNGSQITSIAHSHGTIPEQILIIAEDSGVDAAFAFGVWGKTQNTFYEVAFSGSGNKSSSYISVTATAISKPYGDYGCVWQGGYEHKIICLTR